MVTWAYENTTAAMSANAASTYRCGIDCALCACIVMLLEYTVRQTRINRDLVQAVTVNDLKTVRSLLQKGANSNARKLTEASLSTVWEDISAGALHLWRRQPSPPRDIPPTALLLAVETQNANGKANAGIVKLLLDKGADAHGLDPNGESQVNLAIDRDAQDVPGTYTIANLLLAHGSDVNAKDRAGTSSLHMAAERKKSLPFLNLLLSHGAAVNTQNALGETPLMAALSNWPDIKLVKFLLAHGANPAIRDNERETVLTKCIANNQPELENQLEEINIASVLLDAGANVDDVDKFGSSLLSMSERSPNLFRILVAHGAKIFTPKDPRGAELMLGTCSLPTWEKEDYSVFEPCCRRVSVSMGTARMA